MRVLINFPLDYASYVRIQLIEIWWVKTMCLGKHDNGYWYASMLELYKPYEIAQRLIIRYMVFNYICRTLQLSPTCLCRQQHKLTRLYHQWLVLDVLMFNSLDGAFWNFEVLCNGSDWFSWVLINYSLNFSHKGMCADSIRTLCMNCAANFGSPSEASNFFRTWTMELQTFKKQAISISICWTFKTIILMSHIIYLKSNMKK